MKDDWKTELKFIISLTTACVLILAGLYIVLQHFGIGGW